MILIKVFSYFLVVIVLYFGSVTLALKFYLSELVFIQTSDVESNETLRMIVSDKGNETLIRQYGNDSNSLCVIFFPGKHGGVLRYETELFKYINKLDITLYSLSYPGYEGAKGKASFQNIQNTILQAITYIDKNTSCKTNNSIFVGRSLGASLALLIAEKRKPKGILIDSVALSLSRAIRVKLSQSFFTQSLNILPIENLINNEIKLVDALNNITDIPIVLFQGENDNKTPIKDIEPLMVHYDNVIFHPVKSARHRDTHILARSKYLGELIALTNSMVFDNRVNSMNKSKSP